MNAIHVAVASAKATDRPIALDTQVLIGYMEARDEVARLVSGFVDDPAVRKVVSTVTLAEILTLPASRVGPENVLLFCDAIYRIPGLRVVDLDREVAVATANVRATTGLRLPDAAVVATGMVTASVAIVGNDRRWKQKPLGVPYVHLDDLRAGTPPSCS